ncbi:MAG: hypothetical protein R6W97_09030 [Thiobacillus sp.]
MAFIALALVVISVSIVQYRRALATLKPLEIPKPYCSWSDIVMNLSVVGLGIALMAYLFNEL